MASNHLVPMKVECVEARLGLGAGSPTGLFLFLVFRWSAEGQDRSASLVCGHSHPGSFLRHARWAVWRALSFLCVWGWWGGGRGVGSSWSDGWAFLRAALGQGRSHLGPRGALILDQ